jgi:L-seryl-tRNA(Ser) seleniumtransferase
MKAVAKSGARLIEVGTTNRTHADDYRRAIGPTSGAIVKVHRSNFAVEGFVAEQSAEGDALDQRLHADAVVALAG